MCDHHFAHPAHFVALGFGAGLVPFAPGTFGTLLAFPLWWLIGPYYPPLVQAAILVVLFAVGAWAGALTGRDLGVAAHGARGDANHDDGGALEQHAHQQVPGR